ncbi:MAG: hypothetical protein EON84_09665 [Bradyrhizobiaceae bacterium]|nr:MAG: hypothetical protein EON84_09665 [Bradyrhizobiaceae bacterium]
MAILKYPSAATRPGAGLIDVCRLAAAHVDLFPGVPEMLSPERLSTHEARRSKNSGGGIAPTAFGALIEAVFSTVNDFRTCKFAANAPLRPVK